MSDDGQSAEEERRRLAERATPVPEADALEQSSTLDEDEDADADPSIGDEVPEADALEQSRPVPEDDDERR
jgi:hypothetical protein